MRNRKNILLSYFLLLTIYIFGSLAPALLHHHETQIVSFEDATPCEKTIHYAEKHGACEHKTHVSSEIEKCFFCDHHTFSPHSRITFFKANFKKNHIVHSYQYCAEYIFSAYSSITNKGPPIVLSNIG